MLTESSPESAGSFWPKTSATVASKSVRQVVSSQVVPAFTLAGHRTMKGTR